jgi:hypothetical protein
MQPTPTDKLLKPPRGGGKSKETSGFRSVERCLRNLPKQIPVNQIEISEVDMAFIGKPGRLLGDRKTGERAARRSQTQGRRRRSPWTSSTGSLSSALRCANLVFRSIVRRSAAD